MLARDHAAKKRHRQTNREAVLAREAEYRDANRSKLNAYKREWARAKRARMTEAERDVLRQKGRQWRSPDPDGAKERRKLYRARKRAEIRAYNARWYRENKAAVLTKKRENYYTDTDAARAEGRVRRNARRARVAKSGERYTLAEWRELVDRHGGRCAYCGCKPATLHADHATPLSRGGSNSISNILPACADCNFRKHTLTEAEFRELTQGPRLRDVETKYVA